MSSNGIEAVLGAAWGEDPRYFGCRCRGFAHRTGDAARLGTLHRHRGEQHGSARMAFQSMGTWQQMVLRETTAVTGRFAGNLWTEFWPDIRAHLGR